MIEEREREGESEITIERVAGLTARKMKGERNPKCTTLSFNSRNDGGLGFYCPSGKSKIEP